MQKCLNLIIPRAKTSLNLRPWVNDQLDAKLRYIILTYALTYLVTHVLAYLLTYSMVQSPS